MAKKPKRRAELGKDEFRADPEFIRRAIGHAGKGAAVKFRAYARDLRFEADRLEQEAATAGKQKRKELLEDAAELRADQEGYEALAALMERGVTGKT